MIKETLCKLTEQILQDDQIESPLDRLVTIGSNSLLALHFVSVIEETFDIEIDNDHINHLFFSNYEYLENLINQYKGVTKAI